MGAQLEQLHGDSWVPIAFFSHKLSETEKKYSAFDRELLAAYHAIKHFRHYLEGHPFTMYTDHRPLTTALMIVLLVKQDSYHILQNLQQT